MTAAPSEWLRVKAIVNAAVLLDAAARETYLADACGADDRLRQQVEALLASHDQARTFLEQPVATSAGRATDTLDGRTIGSYRILSRVGAGGMGEVYRAHDSKLDREVAVKLLPGDVSSNADRLRRFHAEARAASSLNHPIYPRYSRFRQARRTPVHGHRHQARLVAWGRPIPGPATPAGRRLIRSIAPFSAP